MAKVDIVRAWKDSQYRETLTNKQLQGLPGNPAGLIELDDMSLDMAAGNGTQRLQTRGCCNGLTAKTCVTKGCGCKPPPTTLELTCGFSASVDPLNQK